MSAYAVKMVAAVKVNGKILREQSSATQDPTVFIPFGSEYSLLLKNLNSQKALVTITIDGEDVGSKFIIKPNSSLDLERWVSDLQQGNKFKFIEKTEQISDFRGDKVDDGIIRIEYQYEQVIPAHNPYTTWYNNSGFDGILYSKGLNNNSTIYRSGVVGSSVNCLLSSCSTVNNNATTTAYNVNVGNSIEANDAGITVKGSVSNQKFATGHIGTLAPEVYVITFKIKGKTANNTVVSEPVTTKMKSQCPSCGTIYRG